MNIVQLLFNLGGDDSLKAKFKIYHEENPHVYEGFEKYAKQLANTKVSVLSANRIYERMRWESDISGNDLFKLNNNYKAYYARLFMYKHPNIQKFHTRKLNKENR